MCDGRGLATTSFITVDDIWSANVMHMAIVKSIISACFQFFTNRSTVIHIYNGIHVSLAERVHINVSKNGE